MRRSCIFLPCFLILFFADAWGKPPGPKLMTMGLFENVSRILQVDNHLQKRKEGLKLIKDYFDFDTFALWTLEDHWENLSPVQQEKFLNLFRGRFYEKTLNQLSRQTKRRLVLRVVSEKPVKEFTDIKCRLKYNGKQVTFSLRWIYRDKKWRLVDVEVSKARLVANYQGQFNKIIRDHGFDEILSRLEKGKIN